MAWTQTDIDNLDSAYAKGAQSVTTSDGKSVTFRSVDEYMRLRKVMQSEVAGSSVVPKSHSVARISKAR